MKKLVTILCVTLLLSATILGMDDHDSVEGTEGIQAIVPGGGVELFYQAQSLDELVYARGWIQGEDKNLLVDNAWDTYEYALSTDIKTICETFGDERLRKNCPFNHAIILQGEPGTGKSTCGFAIGKVLNCRTILIPATDLADSYKNSGTQYLPRLLHLAMQESKKPGARPIILIIDEFNTLTDRHKSDNNSEPGVVEAFFMAIDRLVGSDVFVILTTNAIEDYPASFYSRYNSYTFTISNPPIMARTIIIEHLRKKATYELDAEIADSAWQEFLLALTDSFNFREIQDLFFIARLVACKEVSCDLGRPDPEVEIYQEHFQEAAKRVKANRPSRIAKAWRRSSKYCKEHQAIILVGLGVAGIASAIVTGMIINKWQNTKNEQRHKKSLAQGLNLNESNQSHTTNLNRKTQWGEVAKKKKGFTYSSSVPIVGQAQQNQADIIAGKEVYSIIASTEKAEDLPDLDSLTVHPDVAEQDWYGRLAADVISLIFYGKKANDGLITEETAEMLEGVRETTKVITIGSICIVVPKVIAALVMIIL